MKTIIKGFLAIAIVFALSFPLYSADLKSGTYYRIEYFSLKPASNMMALEVDFNAPPPPGKMPMNIKVGGITLTAAKREKLLRKILEATIEIFKPKVDILATAGVAKHDLSLPLTHQKGSLIYKARTGKIEPF